MVSAYLHKEFYPVDQKFPLSYNMFIGCKTRQYFLSTQRQQRKATQMAKQDDKLFTVAGTARNPDGTVKARFANDLVARIKILNKAGCTDINLVGTARAHDQGGRAGVSPGSGRGRRRQLRCGQRLSDKTAVAKRTAREVTLKTGGKTQDC
jgi:hypothetical protein